MVLTLIDHSDPQIEFTSELGLELMRLKQDLESDSLDPTIAKDIIVAADDTRIATMLSELEMEIIDKEQLAGRTRLIEARRFKLASGQQDVKDFFICLQTNVMSWPDVCMPFTFSLTHSTKCCECGHIHSYSTSQMFVDLDLPVHSAKTRTG